MGEPMDVDLDFKSRFYNLQGILISERKKNFYKLLKSTSTDIPDDQIDIQPRNYQENIFYVDVLIYFKKVDKMTEILKEGMGPLTSRILKQDWYFKEALKNMSEEDIVKKYLPTLSYSVRMKVLKKLSLTLGETRMDTIFDRVLERYGLFIAKQFLFSCSPEKIVYILKNNEIILSTEQLKRLLQKDINLVKIYNEEFKKSKRKPSLEYHNFLKYLAWKHPNVYFDFGLNNVSFVNLGRHTTRAVIKYNKEDVLKDIKNSGFSKAALVKELKEFDKQYLFLYFPEDITALNHSSYSSDLVSFVSKYPTKKRWTVFSHAFKQAYNKEVVDNLDKFEEPLAKFFPPEIQQKWAEKKYFESDNLEYIKYFNAKKAFKLLRDKINVTADIDQRGKLLKELFTVCYLSKDYFTYEEVLKYICTRHRNDDKALRERMMFYLKQHFDYNLVTEAHWKYINELIDLQRVRNENLAYNLITEYLLFLYTKKLPFEGPVTQYIKDCIKGNRSFRLWFIDRVKRPEMESTVLKHIVKTLPTLEHENGEQVTFQVMTDIIEFNKEVKNDKSLNKEFKKTWIDFNESRLIMDLIKKILTKQEPYDSRDCDIVNKIILYCCSYSDAPLKGIDEKRLLDVIKTMVVNKDTGYTVNYTISEVIQKPNRNYFENTLIDYFFANSDEQCSYMKQCAAKYFLAKEPEVLAKHFNTILPIEVESHCDILDFGLIKKYDHLGLSQIVIDYCKALVSLDSKSDYRIKSLNALASVMNTKEFLGLVQDYIPKTKKLDLDDQVQKDLYQVQCNVAKAFKKLDDVSIIAPVLMHFCQGDYLQSSLASLYSVLYRTREEKTFSYINVLEVRAISTRKHAVYLGFELLPVKDAIKIYSELSNKKEKKFSKKCLFKALLKYFVKNALESVQDIVFLNMNFVDKNDTELIRTLVDSASQIPNKYKPLFIEKVWNFLNLLESQEGKVIGSRNRLLHTINDGDKYLILRLNENFFVEDVMRKYFLSRDDRLQKKSCKIDYLVINYLLAYSDEIHFEFVFKIIKDFKDIHWAANNEETVVYISRFFDKAFEKFDENDVKFLKLFTSYWQNLFSRVESFPQYTVLGLMTLYKENPNIEPFCKEVDKFFQDLLTEFGPYVVDLLSKAIRTFFSNIHTKVNTGFNLGNFAFYLLQSNSSDFNCLIAFNIIKDITGPDQKKNYSKVMDSLKAIPTLTSQIYCNVTTG